MPSLGGGGAEKVFVKLAGYFSAAGFEIDFVLARKEGVFLNHLPEKAAIFGLGRERGLRSIIPLMKYLRKERPDCLISAMSHCNAAAIWAKVFSKGGFRLLTTEHIHYSLALKNKNFFTRKLVSFFLRQTYKKAERMIAVSTGIKDDLVRSLKIHPDRIRVIYNPAYDESVISRSKEEINHPFFGSRVILGAGRLTAQKDFKTLIEAFKIVKRKRENIKLIILGEGEERKRLEELIDKLGLKEYVSMPGFVENPYPYMRKASVFALSSRWEGFGVVLVEALACGTPVVSTDCPSGPAEILANGKFGKLVPPADPGKIADAIIETLDQKFEPDTLAARARDFSVGKTARQYLEAVSAE